MRFYEHKNVQSILQNWEHGEMLWYGQDSYVIILIDYDFEYSCFILNLNAKTSVVLSVVIGGFLLWSSNQGSRFKQDEILSALPI